ncbi:MAG TPA: SdrD B-like domain-containing protein [Pyrinomonadaceae bacterium]|nr:SdrD B-like domain-containing protein [Pyrinomonadaceae bacterium]
MTVGGQPVAGVKVRLEGSKLTTATTDGSGYYAFSDLRAGGSYSVTPLRDKTNFKPFNRSFDNLTQDGSADFNGDGERVREPERDSKPESKCTEADESRESKIIIDTYGAAWRESVERDRQKVIRENTRDGEEAEAILVPREPYIVFVKECKAATVFYKYVWQIKVTANAQRLPRELNVSKQRTSGCGKMLGRWYCT